MQRTSHKYRVWDLYKNSSRLLGHKARAINHWSYLPMCAAYVFNGLDLCVRVMSCIGYLSEHDSGSGRRLVGSTKPIDAMNVVSLLRILNIRYWKEYHMLLLYYLSILSCNFYWRADVAEFYKPSARRGTHRLMFEWVKAYFETGSPPLDLSESSDVSARKPGKDVTVVTAWEFARTQRNITSYPPLYLQGEGCYTFTYMQL